MFIYVAINELLCTERKRCTIDAVFHVQWINRVLTLFLLGGGVNLPHPEVFFTELKKYWSEAVEIFWLFLNTQSPPFRPKTGL